MKTTSKKIQESVASIRSKTTLKPVVGIVLGSGLGPLVEKATDAVTISYSEITHFHETSVIGHSGKLVIGKFNGVPTVFMQGRFHRYEGHSMQEVVYPVRTLCALGIHTLVVTNAAGGINTRYRSGDLMIIDDHINFTGDTPLLGPNDPELGQRFPDLSEPYSKNCSQILQETAKELSVTVHTGNYVGVLGPSYETPSEVKMFRIWGADAVGMSTVSEVIAANHMGVRVAGLSCIANLAAGLSPTKLTHQEVMENSLLAAGKMGLLIEKAMPRLAALSSGNSRGL